MMEKVVNGAHDDMPWHVGKTSARFLAVQGAYAMMFGAYTASDLDDLLEHLCEMQEVLDLYRVDKKLLSRILGCMVEKCNEVDSLISVHLNEKWSMERINLVSLAVMRAGVCELLCLRTSECVIINEYVGIASTVLEKSEVNFVNAILNKAKTVRSSACDLSLSTFADNSDGAPSATCEGVLNFGAGDGVKLENTDGAVDADTDMGFVSKSEIPVRYVAGEGATSRVLGDSEISHIECYQGIEGDDNGGAETVRLDGLVDSGGDTSVAEALRTVSEVESSDLLVVSC
ncbi:transcription antitermination factor NusB [Anaplasma phagocytophilum]|uniref:transcription antitermination factor NusB n=1 Tax=Anaplasma phagocytophilum TaxID=948 RepID=UPI00201AF8C2